MVLSSREIELGGWRKRVCKDLSLRTDSAKAGGRPPAGLGTGPRVVFLQLLLSFLGLRKTRHGGFIQKVKGGSCEP